jgi:hypothetical protein
VLTLVEARLQARQGNSCGLVRLVNYKVGGARALAGTSTSNDAAITWACSISISFQTIAIPCCKVEAGSVVACAASDVAASASGTARLIEAAWIRANVIPRLVVV